MAGQLDSQYDIYDLGYDKNLVKDRTESPEADILDLLPQDPSSTLSMSGSGGGSSSGSTGFNGGLYNPVEELIPPQSLISGDLNQILFSGKKTFTDTTAGYRMGLDTDGTYKWIIGGTSNSIDWNVTTANTLTINGTLSGTTLIGGSIHIPDQDTTANSFHVDSTGLLWSGATSTNKATAPVRINPTGEMTLGSPAGTHIQLSGPNVRMRSSDYSAGVKGFHIGTDLVEAENLVARGIMKGTTFQYDVVSAVGGQLLVSNTDVLDSAMTALDASTLTTKGTTTFAANDILLIRAVTSSGIQEEWLRVTNAASAPTYTVTRDLAAAYGANANPAWQAGTTVVKQGVSDGAASYSGGWLRLLGQGTNSPHYSVYSRTGVAYNSYSEAVRLGNLNGIGSFVADTYGIFIGNSSTGNYMQYDTTSGNLVVNDSIISNQDIFGDGSDGDVVISGNTTLTSDMFYDDLTVQTGVTLNPGGFRIFVKGTLTLEGTGKIARNGNNGTNGTNATSTTGGAGTAGTGGAALADGSLKGALAGKDGVNGRDGVNQISVGTTNGQNGNAGNNGTSVVKSPNSNAQTGAAGGAGGSAGGGGASTGGSGGSAGTVTGTLYNKIRNVVSAYNMFDIYPESGGNPTLYAVNAAPSNGGAGSGGSGAAHAEFGASNQSASGSTGGSGGGGSNGGIVWIAARKIVIAAGAKIQANGGNGANAGTTYTSLASNTASAGGSGGSAGGHGGQGGLIIYIYSSLTNSGTIEAVGGTGGTGAAAGAKAESGGQTANDGVAGANGSAGSTGVVIALRI